MSGMYGLSRPLALLSAPVEVVEAPEVSPRLTRLTGRVLSEGWPDGR